MCFEGGFFTVIQFLIIICTNKKKHNNLPLTI